MSIAEAMADAKPTSRPAIHKISWSVKHSTLTCYFEEPSLIGRRFRAKQLEGERRVLVRESEDDSGPAVRLIGGAKTSSGVVISFKSRPLDIADGAHEIRAAASWARGKLSYTLDLPPAVEAPDKPQPTEQRMPRPETLREILREIRRIERETPYRLELTPESGWEFVVRIR